MAGSLAAPAAQAAYRVEIDAPGDLKALLEQHLDLSRYKDREDLSEDQLKFLIDTVDEQVAQLTSTEGYFSPKTKVTVESGEKKTIRLAVDPQQRTVVSAAAVDVAGKAASEAPERVSQIKQNWGLPVGQPFRQADWAKAKEDGLQLLLKKRYPAAKVAQSEARITPEDNDAQLSVQYDSGPGFTLGPLRITGTKRYPNSIIENVNPLQVGEEYSVERLLLLQRQIQNTPYFGNVIVSIDDDPMHAQETPVNVQVTEFQTQRIRTGLGYASDTGAQVQGRYTNYNVFGKAWVFDAQTKIEQRRQYGALDLSMPPDSRSFVNGVNGSYDRTTLQGVDLRSMKIGLKRARSLENYDTALTLDYYRDRLQQTDGAVLPPNTVIQPGQHQALVPGFSWVRRAVDNSIFPRSGHIFSIQTGFAVKGFLTDQTFFRADGRYKYYFPVAKRDVVILRTELGGVFTAGSSAAVPASLLFRAGGNESVRGYSYESIGNSQNGTVYPTKYMVTASAEYQHWISEQWGGALFYDAGTATDSWARRSIKVGVGPGVRYRSPVGTVNLDLAYGVQAKQFRPHISLGIAF
ncbi:translocation and assembly module TamA [Collimonas sp. PA-H2]|uniref:autotransporter assembly complex protein TamA n=1 Tax=Collimonas sp. PA-H2 TaxID=1881062 RepID=UPI000BF573D7|nr:autotransporter assembly complex family protein [Collimonas sp. PA-H2]PFH08338.1 translocation and assembly module TamA [Collimonas sp. PA-H2]